MVKVPGPLFSLEAHGWLGKWVYGRRNYWHGAWHNPKGVVPTPYPIGFTSQITVPNAWTFSLFGNTYKVPRFGLRPYGPFISNYYSPLGWCYQRRRTWHGVIWAAMRPPISKNKKTQFQLGYQGKFRDAVTTWHGMTQATKDVYNTWRYPVHASGFNRFLSWYLNHTLVTFSVLATADKFDNSYFTMSYAMCTTYVTSVGQSFGGIDGVLDSVDLFLSRTHDLVGTFVVKIYNHSGVFGVSSVPTGASLATSDPVTAEDLPEFYNAPRHLTFSGANRINVSLASKYIAAVEYTGGDAYSYINVGADTVHASHWGNICYLYHGSWLYDNTVDMCFAVNVQSTYGPTSLDWPFHVLLQDSGIIETEAVDLLTQE